MDEMVTNDLWWYSAKWFHQPEESWPNGNVKIINQNTLLGLAKQSNGPTVLYKISASVGELLQITKK